MRRLIKTPNGFAWCALVVSAEAILILWPLGQRETAAMDVMSRDAEEGARLTEVDGHGFADRWEQRLETASRRLVHEQ